jgi:hypothetical protein
MAEQMEPNSILKNIQDKIYDAFVKAIVTDKPDDLNKIDEALFSLYKENPQNLVVYWNSYLKFYQSVYYLQHGEDKKAEKLVDTGIDWLKELKKKNSEDYALLSMLQGYSLQFKGMRAMFISGEVNESAERAISLDSTNLRAYYVYGSNDFYTPEKYGGGKKAENYLLKALSLPSQKINNEYLPSWGRAEAYELLIKLYMRNESWEKAKEYFRKAKAEFPDSYIINQLAPELVGK